MTAKEMHLHSPFSPPPTHPPPSANKKRVPQLLPGDISTGRGEEAGVCRSLRTSSAWDKAGCSTADREEGPS